jgi:hypothetical protein
MNKTCTWNTMGKSTNLPVQEKLTVGILQAHVQALLIKAFQPDSVMKLERLKKE